jgi:hypothetical protein
VRLRKFVTKRAAKGGSLPVADSSKGRLFFARHPAAGKLLF